MNCRKIKKSGICTERWKYLLVLFVLSLLMKLASDHHSSIFTPHCVELSPCRNYRLNNINGQMTHPYTLGSIRVLRASIRYSTNIKYFLLTFQRRPMIENDPKHDRNVRWATNASFMGEHIMLVLTRNMNFNWMPWDSFSNSCYNSSGGGQGMSMVPLLD